MITPSYLNKVVRKLQSKLSEIDAYLIGRIAKRMVALFDFNGDVKVIPTTLKDLHKLINRGYTLQEIQREVEDVLPGVEEEVREAFDEARKKIAEDVTSYTNEVITVLDEEGHEIKPLTTPQTRMGVPKGKMGLTTPEIRRIDAIYRRTKGTVRNMTRTTASECNKLFIDECDKAFLKIKAGVNKNTAICEAIQSMAEHGVCVVDYPSGKTDKAEVAIARAVRTGINMANAEVVLLRSAELGIQHVYVSQHLGARVTKALDYTNHSYWQGKVYSLDYKNPILKPYADEANKGVEEYVGLKQVRETISVDRGEYPDFIESCGYGNILGICGINCRHTFSMFMAGVNKEPARIDEAKSAEKYKAEQKARAMERGIRKTLKLIEGLKAVNSAEGKEALKVARGKLERQDEAYRAFCKENKITPENWRKRIT